MSAIKSVGGVCLRQIVVMLPTSWHINHDPLNDCLPSLWPAPIHPLSAHSIFHSSQDIRLYANITVCLFAGLLLIAPYGNWKTFYALASREADMKIEESKMKMEAVRRGHLSLKCVLAACP